jgi:hypothetical protein
MNKETNEIDPLNPTPGETQDQELKDTLGWVLNVVLKVGAGYLAKMIIDALGF